MTGQTGIRRRAAAVLAVAAGLAAGSSAAGQGKADARRTRQGAPVVIGPMHTLQTGPGGRPSRAPGGPADSCNVLSSHTDAPFAAGTQVALQLGLAEQEQIAASYTLAASEFPIKINLTEVLLGSVATITTTTQWTLSYYSGLPTTGTLIQSFSSDGTELPHIVVAAAPGGGLASATHLQFSIDPGDPEQVIIPDDGSHTFTVAFRIDHHNSPPANPCSPAAQTSNAFPCTDTSVSSLSGNWLYALNCPSSLCTGWASFSNLLPIFCRPMGDWVMRANWSSLSCAPGIGACCLPNGTCEVIAIASCQTQNGIYRGDGSSCGTANCPVPTGACCTPGGCGIETQGDCTIAGGVWQGGGSTCVGGQCPTGACCLPDGSCIANVSSSQCTAQNGVYRGANSTCIQANCPQPTGACCFSTGGCLLRTQAQCTNLAGTWSGVGTTCPVGGCAQPCYANCDGSTVAPLANVADYICFLNRFAAGDSYANCDSSTVAPVLNVNDFVCFNNRYAGGCP